MSGSYRAIVDSDGGFRGIELIENLGDAWEALEECYAMIDYLTKGDKNKIYEAWLNGCCPEYNIKYQSFDKFWKRD